MLFFLLSLFGLIGLFLWVRWGGAVSNQTTQRNIATVMTWIVLSFLLLSTLFVIIGFGLGAWINEFPTLAIMILLACTWGIYLAGQAFAEQSQKPRTPSATPVQGAQLPSPPSPPLLEQPPGYGPPPR